MPLLCKNMTIGELVQAVPGSEAIIGKYFHGGCHHCPSRHSEPLWLAAKLYNHDVDEILEALRTLPKRPLTSGEPNRTTTARERRLARERQRPHNEDT